jgi:4-amino-4-deoxy-L-arabinose transferase-like glycosyltransferase
VSTTGSPIYMLRKTWNTHGWLIVILVAGLVMRVAIAFFLANHDLTSDEPEYMGAALTLAQGRGFSFFDSAPWLRPPLYIMFLALPIKLWGLQTAPIVVTQILISESTIGLLYLIGRRLFNHRVGLFTAAACALYLPLSVFAGLMLSETLFLALFASGVLLLFKVSDGNRPVLWAAWAGLALSLAGQTRGLLVAFVPVAAVWIFFSLRDRVAGLKAAGVFMAVFVALLLPWTARNFVAYHAIIPSETTGAVNLWLGAHEGSSGQVYSQLAAAVSIPERQSLAYSQAFAEIKANPGTWLAHGVDQLGDLAKINYSGDERFVHGFTHGLVPASYLAALFLLDDTVYPALVCLAIIGMLFAWNNPRKWLILLWVALSCGLAVVFFAINRFRVPVLPFVFPFAGYAVLEVLPRLRDQYRWAPRLIAGAILAAGFLFVVAPTYPLDLTRIGVTQAVAQANLAAGDQLLGAGELDQALTAYRQADPNLPETHAAMARVKVQQTNYQAANNLIRNDSKYYGSRILMGDIARTLGDVQAARTYFADPSVKDQTAVDWAWDMTAPVSVNKVDVGNGLDLGYIWGMDQVERDADLNFRWTGGEARLKFPQFQGHGGQLSLRLNGWRPSGAPAAPINIWANGKSIGSILPVSGWETYRITLPHGTVVPGEDLVIVMKTDVFTPGFKDNRFLGVMIDWASIEPGG